MPPSSPRSAATPTWPVAGGQTADEIKRRHPRARPQRRAACCASTTRPTRWTPRSCWPAKFGFLPRSDAVCTPACIAIADELTENGFVLRYRTEETDDGLAGKEGTFLICSFWLVSALAIIGEEQRARDLMERLLRVASPARPLRRGVRRRHRAPPGKLPAGVLPSGADRGGGADHPHRAVGRDHLTRRLIGLPKPRRLASVTLRGGPRTLVRLTATLVDAPHRDQSTTTGLQGSATNAAPVVLVNEPSAVWIICSRSWTSLLRVSSDDGREPRREPSGWREPAVSAVVRRHS